MTDLKFVASLNGPDGFLDPDEVPRAVVADAVTMGRVSLPRHRHHKAELIYAAIGVIDCDVEGCF